MSEIKMHKDSSGEWPDYPEPGTFDIIREGGEDGRRRTFCMFACPRKPGRRCGVFVTPSVGVPNQKVWQWDGNEEAPTLSPSIHCLETLNGKPAGGCGWHGFIQHGVMREV